MPEEPSREPGGERPATLGAGVAPGPLTPAERRELFRRPLLARLATVRADGAPHIAPLWFHHDEADGSFWFVIRERARFVPNLLREPRVCISIAAESMPYARATILGRAEIVARPEAAPDAWLPIARLMVERYVGPSDPAYLERTRRYPRWLVRVVPYEMLTWRGGGWARYYTGDA